MCIYSQYQVLLWIRVAFQHGKPARILVYVLQRLDVEERYHCLEDSAVADSSSL